MSTTTTVIHDDIMPQCCQLSDAARIYSILKVHCGQIIHCDLTSIAEMPDLRGRLIQQHGTDVSGLPYALARLELYVPGDPPSVLAYCVKLLT